MAGAGLLQRAEWYFDYLFSAKGIQYIHSPFLFSLMQQAFPEQLRDAHFQRIEEYRKELRSSDQIVNILDLGAGSRMHQEASRKVSSIARHAVLPAAPARLLARIVRYMNAAYGVELGTSLGVTSQYLAAAIGPEGKLITIEGSPQIADLAEKGFQKSKMKQIQLVRGHFDEKLGSALSGLPRVDFLYIDGNHREEPTLRYFEESFRYFHKSSFVILDDIYWSAEMKSAWEKIRMHPSVTLSFDVFRLGIVFFNPDLSKQHFRLRY